MDRQLFENPARLASILRRSGLDFLLRQFDAALAEQPDEPLRMIRQALALSAEALATEPEGLYRQLLGRLAGASDPRLQRFVDRLREAEAQKSRGRLVPRGASLNRPEVFFLGKFDARCEDVKALEVLPENRLMVVGWGGRLSLWDANQRTAIKIYRKAPTRSVARLHSGQVALGEEDGGVTVIDPSSGKEVARHSVGTEILVRLRQLPDGRLLVASWYRKPSVKKRSLHLLDLDSGEATPFESCRFATNDVAVLRDGLVAVAGQNGLVSLVDPQSGECVAELSGHPSAVRCLAVSPDGATLVSADDGGTLRFWNLSSRVCERKRNIPGRVSALLFLDDNRLVVGTESPIVWIWPLDEAEPTIPLEQHTGPISGLAPLGDGRFASSSWDGTVVIWDGDRPQAFDGPGSQTSGTINALVDLGESLVASSAYDETLRLWRVEDGQILETLRTPWLHCIAKLDGRRVVGGSDTGSLHLFDFDRGSKTKIGQWDEGPVEEVVVPTSDVAFAVLVSEDENIEEGATPLFLWRLSESSPTRLEGTEGNVLCLTLGYEGHVLAGSDRGEVGVFEAATGECLEVLQVLNEPVEALASLGPGRFATGDYDGAVSVFHRDGGRLAPLGVHGNGKEVYELAVLSPNRLVSCAGSEVILWDLERGEALDTFLFDSIVWTLVCPNETTVVAGTNNGVVFLEVLG